jgi:glycerophosphoryl diester phosphodiesterase
VDLGRKGTFVLVFGHRGAAGEAPENTLTGFAHAVRIGVRAFELDVRLSADGELVLSHDESLLRTVGVDGNVRDFSVDQLRALDARLLHPAWPDPAPIPTLAEVFSAFPNQDAYQIEIKSTVPTDLPTICARLAALVDEHGLEDRVMISSFEPAALKTMAEIAPELPRTLIGSFDSPAWIDQALALDCQGVCISHQSGTDEVVDLAHEHGFVITGWPANTPDEIAQLLAWDVAHITSDYPKRALNFLSILHDI